MARAKVRLADNIARVVLIDPDATDGATLGRNLFLPSGQAATPQTLREYIFGAGGAGAHSALSGLQAGDDHPQYTMWQARERITAQWDFTQPVRTAFGSAALPAFTFTSDNDTGWFRSASDAVGLGLGGTSYWDASTAQIYQTIPLVVNNNDGVFVESEATADVGFEIKVFDDPGLFGSGGHLAFWETPDRLYGMRIRHEGDLSPTAGDLVFYGHDNSASGIRIMTLSRDVAQVKLESGSVSIPSLTFRTDTNTGIYSPFADGIGFAIGGVSRAFISSARLWSAGSFHAPNGTETAPAFSFDSDQDTGLYLAFTNGIAFAAGGAARATISTARLWSAGPIHAPNGTETVPAFSFDSDQDTGIYRITTNQLGAAEGGVQTMRFAFANPTASIGLTAVNGTSLQPMRSDAAPALSQSISPTWTGAHTFTGLFNVGDPGTESGSVTLDGATYSAVAKINEFGGANDAALILHRHATAAAVSANLLMSRARGTTSSHTDVQNGDVLGRFIFAGWHTNSYWRAAEIDAQVSGTPGTNDMPGVIIVKVSADGSNTPGEVARFTSSQFATVNGSASAPPWSFASDLNTGFYRIGADNVGVACGGSKILDIGFASEGDAGQAALGIGTVNGPIRPLHLSVDLSGNNTIAAFENRSTVDGSSLVFSFRTTTTGAGAADLVETAGFLGRVSNHDHATVDSTCELFGATNGVRDIGWVVSGTQARGCDGSVSAPGIAFINDTNTGFYRSGADAVRGAAGGADSIGFDSNATAGNTRFLIYDVDNGTLERVSVGAADSGGTGYKVLRIPN